MFDITSSKLLILGIVALLVIGPKDLPALLRTIGKYVGIIKRHAADFRAQFEDAIRDSEIDQLRKDVEKIGTETQSSFAEAEHAVSKELTDARGEVDAALEAGTKPVTDPLGADPLASDPTFHDADRLPAPSTASAAPATAPLNGTGHSAESPAPEPPAPEHQVAGAEETSAPAPAEPRKSGA